jgi:hypothetical protein
VIAKQADDLYFGGPSGVPKYGGGINVELARSSYEYLLPDMFANFFAGDFDDEAFKDAAFQRSSKWVASLSPYAFVRLTKVDSKVGVSLIPSYTLATTLGYSSSYEKPLFCPPLDTSVPFTTSGCRRFYAKAPKFAEVETIALEARTAFTFFGVDMIASPKVSWNDQDRKDYQPWLTSLPLLAFTDSTKTSAIGFKFDWASGQIDEDGLDEDDDFLVKLVYQKSFNLTGK